VRAFVLEDFDSQPGLRDVEGPPEPGEGELVVRVRASSANPIDNAIAAGMLRQMADYRFPVILGRDFAGVVEQAGAGSDLQEGDEVFGLVPGIGSDIHNGAWTESALIPPGQGARKPEGVGFEEAGAAAVAALTAMAAVDAVAAGNGDTVLIVGAAGGVGVFATQLAKRAGARVIAPGLDEDEGFLAGLGVDDLIPRDGDIAAAARELAPDGVDALIDTVSRSPEDLDVFAAALKDGGAVASPTHAAGDGPNRHNVGGSAEGGALERLAELLGSGDLRVPIQRSYPLEQAGSALADLQEQHTQGKLGITLA
jgi:NADPH:quinone reductase